MADGSRAAVLLNRGASEQKITLRWNDLGYPAHLSASLRDLWSHKDLGSFKEKFEASVPSHGVIVVKVQP
jgi:alpha-galactosidase